MKTNRDIDFELEVLSHDYNSVHVLVTCQEGSESFDIKTPYRIEENDEVHTMIMNHDLSWFDDLDMSEVFNWVDEVTISWIASEASRVCLLLSNESVHYQFAINYLNKVSISISGMSVVHGICVGQVSYQGATGEELIKDLLNSLKYGI